MNPTRQLHDLGQRLWLDSISRAMLDDGSLQTLIEQFSVTGLTSNPTLFAQAIAGSNAYDAGIVEKAQTGLSGEPLFIALALEDLRRAADLFRPCFDSSDGADGWVSIEISPLLAADMAGSIAAAISIHALADRPNLLVKIPGTRAGLPAIEEAIFRGIPVNVTLLFSREHYLAAAKAYMRGIERRLAAGLDPRVASVASLFVSRWDQAVNTANSADRHKQIRTARARLIYREDRDAGIDPQIAATLAMTSSQDAEYDPAALPATLHNRLGIAMAGRCYHAYRELLAAPRWQALAAAGAFPQRLLWASTGTKDAGASDSLYVEALAAPDTIDTMPEKTLRAFAAHGELHGLMAEDGGDAEDVLSRFGLAGVDVEALASTLQAEGTALFVQSWQQLLRRLGDRHRLLTGAAAHSA